MNMIIPNKLKTGDTIGIVAPSDPIIGDNIEEIKKAKEKADDINQMFKDKEVKMIWCAKRRKQF